MICLSVKSMILLSVNLSFSLLQIAHAITSKNLCQPDAPRFTRLLVTQYDCFKQYNFSDFNLTGLQKCNQALSSIEFTRKFAFVFIRAKLKRTETFFCSKNTQKNRVFPLRVHIPNGIDTNVWIGTPIPCHYQKNSTQTVVKILPETLMVWIALNWIKIVIMALPHTVIDRVFKFKLKKKTIHCYQTEYCT